MCNQSSPKVAFTQDQKIADWQTSITHRRAIAHNKKYHSRYMHIAKSFYNVKVILLSQGKATAENIIFKPSHDVFSSARHQNHDGHFYLSSSPCPCLHFDLYDDVCASCALYLSPSLYPCAFYASFPCL